MILHHRTLAKSYFFICHFYLDQKVHVIYTNNCTIINPAVQLLKFADDITIIGFKIGMSHQLHPYKSLAQDVQNSEATPGDAANRLQRTIRSAEDKIIRPFLPSLYNLSISQTRKWVENF